MQESRQVGEQDRFQSKITRLYLSNVVSLFILFLFYLFENNTDSDTDIYLRNMSSLNSLVLRASLDARWRVWDLVL